MAIESSDLSRDEELDRVVSRRVEDPTAATAGDERAYRAADPDPEHAPDSDPGGAGSTAERESRDQRRDEDDEPLRSE
jgi:hypothetical protein